MNWEKINAELQQHGRPHPDNFLDYFDGSEKDEVVNIFKQLGIPLPQKANFLPGIEGGLIFHTDSGVVIRAESQNSQWKTHHNAVIYFTCGVTTDVSALPEEWL